MRVSAAFSARMVPLARSITTAYWLSVSAEMAAVCAVRFTVYAGSGSGSAGGVCTSICAACTEAVGSCVSSGCMAYQIRQTASRGMSTAARRRHCSRRC